LLSQKSTINILNRIYNLNIFNKGKATKDTTEILMPHYLGFEATEIAVRSLQKHTKLPIRIWVIATRLDEIDKLIEIPEINLIGIEETGCTGSEENALALEIGSRFVENKWVFVCHNDVFAYDRDWLQTLFSKVSDKVRAVAYCRDNARVNALHVSSTLFNFELFKSLNLSFFPKYDNKDLQIMDVGDEITVGFKEKGYDVHVFSCSHNDPSILEVIHQGYPELKEFFFDKTIDENGKVIWLHLGRGVPKFLGIYSKTGRCGYEEWIELLKNRLKD